MMSIRNLRIARSFTIALLVLLAGCESGAQGPKPMKVAPRPPAAPAVPPAQNVPLDPQLQTSARQEITVAFESNDPVIRANAIEAAQNALGADGSRAMTLRGLGDSDPLVRFAAAMAAGQLRLREAYQPLLRLANDPSARVRIGVRFALHRLGDTRLSHDLEQSARDPNKYIRGQTVMVLGLLGEKSALKILRQMQTDLEPIVRFQTAEAMWRLGDEEGLQTLVAGSISQFADDQVLCVLALAGPKDRRVAEHIRGKLSSSPENREHLEVALAAARAMGELGLDEGYGVAMRGAKSPDPRQKVLAALAFGAIGRSDSQQYLAPLLRDPEQSVRLAAATAMLQLGRSSVTQAQ